MLRRPFRPGISQISTIHWERRLFDALVPLPDGTSYNAYLLQGSTHTALIDSTDPIFSDEFMRVLADVSTIDYIISLHTEQDHSGTLPVLLQRYPQATLLCSKKAEELLPCHLGLDRERIRVVADGEEISLGDKTLKFIYTPWVHWPETMSVYAAEDQCLFSCDFFGSHLACSDIYVTDPAHVYEGAKRYYAEIMMPFRTHVEKNLNKLAAYPCALICPSHGPIYDQPELILNAYREWVSPQVKNVVVLPFISMHGSTRQMVNVLTDALIRRGVTVYQFDLEVTDIGKLAIELVDAATLVVATPTVHVGPHPAVTHAVNLANILRPKAKYAAVLASYGWASKAIEQVAAHIPNLKVNVLGTVQTRGLPTADTLAELDALAEAIAQAHRNDPDVVD